MMMSASDCMVRALEMDARAANCAHEPAKTLYQRLADEWRHSYDHAIWREDSAAHR
jgi:hypothetical protein